MTLVLVSTAIGLMQCTVNQSLSGRNVSHLYKPIGSEIKYETAVYHRGDSTTVLLRFAPNALIESKSKDGTDYFNYSIRYRLFQTYSSPQSVDSGVVIRKDILSVGRAYLMDSISVPSEQGFNYVLECVVRDFNASAFERRYIDLYRSQALNNQSIRLYSDHGRQVYTTYVTQPDSYLVATNIPYDQLYMKYYDRNFPIASPPFSTITPKPFDFTPNEVLEANRRKDGQFQLIIDKPGFYQLTNNVEDRSGATLFYFNPFYPEAKTLLSLVEPLRYISTNEEFQQVMESEDMKKGVDAYWLKIGDNPQRAKELIRSYYSRVQFSNEYFTSYIEGWKSDRGMCYIVFGPPDIVYRSTATETWLYGEEGKYNSLSLTFTKVVNPFTSNDFRLNRSSSLKNPWYRAVEFWRQGRVLTYQ